MAVLTQILVLTFIVIAAECHLRLTDRVHNHHHPRIHPYLQDGTLLVLISDFDHLGTGFDHDQMTRDPFLSRDLSSNLPLLNEPSAIDDPHKIEIAGVDGSTETNPEISASDIQTEIKQQVKRDSDESEVKPSAPPVRQDDDEDIHAIQYPGPHDGIKTNADSKDANVTSTEPDGPDVKDKDDSLSKNSDYLLIPVATAYNPSLAFASRFDNDQTSDNPNTAVLLENIKPGVNSYQAPPPNIQDPTPNSDINLQNTYNPNQGLWTKQPTYVYDNTVPQNPSNVVLLNNYPASNNIGSNQPAYNVADPNNMGVQGTNSGAPGNQYYVTNNPQQSNPGYQSNNVPQTYNLVPLYNQPNNLVPLYNQPSMVPLNNQPNNFVAFNNQPNNMVPVYNQPNNVVTLSNQPNNLVSLHNQPSNNNFVGQSNIPYGGMNNQPNNLILLNNPQNNMGSLNHQPSNSGGMNYIRYDNQPNNLVSLNNQPNNFVPLNNQPSYLVHIDNLPNNFVPNNQQNNMVPYQQPGNQPTYLISNQPNNLGSYGNQPNNLVVMNGGGPAMMSDGNVPMTPANNVNSGYPLYAYKEEADSGNDNKAEKSTEKP